MTPKVNYFEQIEDYCQHELDNDKKLQFEAELLLDTKLSDEVKLRIEIQSAIEEFDVTSLRNKLRNVDSLYKNSFPPNSSFELLDKLSEINETNRDISYDELMGMFDSMPKVHLHQHETSANENTHRFYKQQEKLEGNGELDFVDDIDLNEFEGLEDAILEKDILDLRHAINQASKSIEPQFSVGQIDAFLNDELTDVERKEFGDELSNNQVLKEEVQLHEELEDAIGEEGIIDLRSRLLQIMKSETSWNVSANNIEDFINGELDDALLEEFNTEFEENSDLAAEVELRRQVNEMVGETDIRELRAELIRAKELAANNKVRNLIPAANNKVYKFLRKSVAVILFVVGVGAIYNSGYLSTDKTYDKYYESPTWSAERSVSTGLTIIQEAQNAFNEGNYKRVVRMNESAPPAMGNNPAFRFYVAASLQNIENYKQAITEYTKVMKHGDNLFIEEAEWYRSLCYMKLGNKQEARRELLAVVNRNGYYMPDAKAILRRLKFMPE